MAVFDDFKAALALLDAAAPVRIQLGEGGQIFQVAASELMTPLGVKAAAHRRYRVLTPHLNIRANPTVSAALVDQIAQDTVFDVLDTAPVQADSHSWLPLADGRGWVAVDVAGPPDAPVVSMPALPETPGISSPQSPTMGTTSTGSAVSTPSGWSLPFSAAQRGVGLSAGGWAPNSQQLSLIQRNGVEFALICAYEPGQAAATITPLRNNGVKAFIVRACTHDKPTTPTRFTDLTLPLLREYGAAIGGSAPLMIAIGNEPNIMDEGWGSAWADGAAFGRWWAAVAAIYRATFPAVKLGFPALSPGGDVPGVRLSESTFLAGASEAIQSADWIGVHYYWVNSDGADINPPAVQWRTWFGADRLIVGTEVGPCNSTTVTSSAVRRAYGAFGAVGIPVCAWLLSGAGAWRNAAWDVNNLLL